MNMVLAEFKALAGQAEQLASAQKFIARALLPSMRAFDAEDHTDPIRVA
jgi:hypothetical protein